MFSIDATDVGRIEEKLTRVGNVASDMTPLWPMIGEIFAEQQRDIFASGFTWAPLERSTVVKKGSSQILVESGRLMQAATSATPVESNALVAKFGIRHGDVPYAHWHARGAGVPERRPVPPLSPAAISDILKTVAERVRQEWSG